MARAKKRTRHERIQASDQHIASPQTDLTAELPFQSQSAFRVKYDGTTEMTYSDREFKDRIGF